MTVTHNIAIPINLPETETIVLLHHQVTCSRCGHSSDAPQGLYRVAASSNGNRWYPLRTPEELDNLVDLPYTPVVVQRQTFGCMDCLGVLSRPTTRSVTVSPFTAPRPAPTAKAKNKPELVPIDFS